MLIKTFKSNQPSLLLVLIMLALLLWIDAFFLNSQTGIVIAQPAPLYALFAGFFQQYTFISVLTGFLFLLFQAFLLNHIITTQNLVDRNSYLPALIYLVLMSNSFGLLGMHPVMFANFFLILALNKIFQVYNEDDVFVQIYNVGTLVSIASLFYLPALWLLLLMIAALVIYYLVNLRAIMASILGFLTPYLFLALYYYWYDMGSELQALIPAYQLTPDVFSQNLTPYTRVSFAVLSLISIIVILRTYLNPITEKPIRIRKRYHVILAFLLIVLASTLFAGETLSIHHGMIMLPLSIILAGFFQDSKARFWNELFFTLIMLLILIGKLARLD